MAAITGCSVAVAANVSHANDLLCGSAHPSIEQSLRDLIREVTCGWGGAERPAPGPLAKLGKLFGNPILFESPAQVRLHVFKSSDW